MTNHTIWMTRPKPDGDSLAAFLSLAGHHIISAPLLTIRPKTTVNTSALKSANTILITSANGVRSLASLTKTRDTRLICVGDVSAETARQLGFTQVESAAQNGVSNSQLLTQYIAKNLTPNSGKIIHISGSAVAGDLVGSLAKNHYDIERLVCYHADAILQLPAISSASIVLFYSLRTAATAVGLLPPKDAAKLTAICLSEQVAKAARKANFRAIHVLPNPEPKNLLSLLTKIH